MANDKRRRPRQRLNIQAWIDAGDDTQPLRCTVVDISETGARLAVGDSIAAPDQFDLILSRGGHPGQHCNVVWRLHGLIGIEFVAHTQAGDAASLGGDVGRIGNPEFVSRWPADLGSLAACDSASAALLRRISALLAGSLRRIRLPLGM